MLCGWHTLSDIPLTCVPRSARAGSSVDVLIQIAPGHSPIAENATRAILEHSAQYSLIRIGDVADFEVSGGRQIRIWPAVGAAQKDIEIFLLGQAWAALCHQRRLLPLHASAILINGDITAFAGHSGAGKSTIAAVMGSFGCKLVTDDILPISFNQNSIPGAWPYLRRMKLHADLITKLALTPMELVGEALDKEKYFICPKYAADDKWSRLKQVYLLEVDPAVSCISIDHLTGAEAVHALIDHTYHFNFILGTAQFHDHLELCIQLASKVRVYRLRRSPSVGTSKELGYLICSHLENVPT
jgi:hypothetical protein